MSSILIEELFSQEFYKKIIALKKRLSINLIKINKTDTYECNDADAFCGEKLSKGPVIFFFRLFQSCKSIKKKTLVFLKSVDKKVVTISTNRGYFYG